MHSSLFTLIVLLLVYLQGGMPLKHQQAGGSTLQVNATRTAIQVHFEHSICIWPQCAECSEMPYDNNSVLNGLE